jgi:molecular chaperone GrpE
MSDTNQNQEQENINNNSAENMPLKKEQNETEVKEQNSNQLQEKDAKIAQLEKAILELNDKLLRSFAEADNNRKRAREELEKANKYAISNFVNELVVVVENFFLATDNAPNVEIEKNPAVKNFADAIVMTKKELVKILEKNFVSRIYPLGEKFDHHFHEAIAQIESDQEEGTITQVIQAGYKIADRLIKPALVAIAKPKAS